ncbi:MAG: ABC transporter ATP-binding protein [Rhizobiaceae bacterium]|nr:ABC transporter ATP-binding protein [Rhizobiaceae bacterium]
MHAALNNIRVAFGPLVAVDDVSIAIAAGEVHAVVGENGAGKSTLMNVLFGLIKPEAGTIEVEGVARNWASPQDAIRAGLGMVHQHFMLQEEMTVLENIVLCGEPVNRFGFVDFNRARQKLADGFREHGIVIDLDATVGGLAVGQRQVVEILKMLYRDARLLILDEPTAVLTPQEKDRLFGILRSFAASGKSIVIITHKLDEVLEIADRVSVMRGGRLVSSGPLGETSKDRIAREIIGGDLPPPLKPAARTPGEVVLSVRGLRAGTRGWVGPLSFDVHAGEIVGIAGVSGNGQAELIRALAGLAPGVAGEIMLNGQPVDRLDVGGRRRTGMSYIPEDRQRAGLALGATVAENANAGRDDVSTFSRGPFLDRAAMASFARGLIERYRIKVAGPSALASTMSGGNKQKLVVGRELARGTPLVIAENPTWGVDIGAIELIHAELLRMRDQGHAVLLVSTELDEILRLSDRVLVMYSGTLSEPIEAADADRNRIGALMTSRTDAALRSVA